MATNFIHSVQSAGGQSMAPRVVLFEDFVTGPASSTTDDAATFDLVGTSAALTLADDELNGVGTLVSNSTNPAFLIQNGEPFKAQAGITTEIEARVNLTDADGMSFFFGLAPTTANPLSSVTDYIGFFSTDGNIKVGTSKDGAAAPGSGAAANETDVDTGADFADDTWVVLKAVISGTDHVRFYVDGELKNTITSTIVNNENLAVHIGCVGSGETVDIDYVIAAADRDITA